MKRALSGAALLVLVGACAHRLPRGGETITYQTTPCKGPCPVYAITLGPDGQGIFTAEANAGAVGDHRFQASPQETRGFLTALAKARPNGERVIKPGSQDCGEYVTDQSTIDVSWQGADGPGTHLRLYLGCRGARAAKLRAALQGLPITYLPLEPFLGSD